MFFSSTPSDYLVPDDEDQQSTTTSDNKNRETSASAQALLSRPVQLLMATQHTQQQQQGFDERSLSTETGDMDPRDLPKALRPQHGKAKTKRHKHGTSPQFDMDVFYDARSRFSIPGGTGTRSDLDFESVPSQRGALPSISEHMPLHPPATDVGAQKPPLPKMHHRKTAGSKPEPHVPVQLRHERPQEAEHVQVPLIRAQLPTTARKSRTLDDVLGQPGNNTEAQQEYKFSQRSLPDDDELQLKHQIENMENVAQQQQQIFRYDPNCPIHGTIRRRQQQQQHHLLDAFSPVTDIPLAFGTAGDSKMTLSDIETEFKLLTSQTYAAKLARKLRRQAVEPAQRRRNELEKAKIWTNLLVVSVSMLFLFTAFHGLQNVQTTVHTEYKMGAISLAVLYFSQMTASLVLPPYILNRLGSRRTMLCACFFFALYVTCNYVSAFYALIPASVALGATASCLWAAHTSYLTEMGIRYALINYESPKIVIIRFYGVCFMILSMGQVFGNLISWYIFHVAKDLSITSINNSDFDIDIDTVDKSCGHYYGSAPLTDLAKENLSPIPEKGIVAVCAVYIACTLIAGFIVAIFLTPLARDLANETREPLFNFKLARLTFQNLARPRNIMLIPLTVFAGMEQAFIVGEFTKAFAGCCLGIPMIGLVMCMYGVANGLCSLVFGPLIMLFGRPPLFAFGGVVNALMIVTMLMWPPNWFDQAIFYVIAWAWGMATGAWNTQLSGFWIVLMGDNLEIAFTTNRIFECAGFCIQFLIMAVCTTQAQLSILMGILGVGMIGYMLAELYDTIVLLFRGVHPTMSESVHTKETSVAVADAE